MASNKHGIPTISGNTKKFTCRLDMNNMLDLQWTPVS